MRQEFLPSQVLRRIQDSADDRLLVIGERSFAKSFDGRNVKELKVEFTTIQADHAFSSAGCEIDFRRGIGPAGSRDRPGPSLADSTRRIRLSYDFVGEC
jgi:hypothetical protein